MNRRFIIIWKTWNLLLGAYYDCRGLPRT